MAVQFDGRALAAVLGSTGVDSATAQAGFVSAPGPLVYKTQPESFDALIAAWAIATGTD
jgi:hypothetical protein